MISSVIATPLPVIFPLMEFEIEIEIILVQKWKVRMEFN